MKFKLEDFSNFDKLESLFKNKNKKMDDNEIEDIFSFRHTPPFIKGELRPYQLEGVNWLIDMHERNINCILADEMGLGKTLQTITFLGYCKFVIKETKPNLLIVPKSILYNWKSEFKKFIKDYRVFVFHGLKDEIRGILDEYYEMEYDCVITTYEMCMRFEKVLKQKWLYVIIDEAHRIKNDESLLSKIVRRIDCEHRLLLTGTPLQNNVKELWSLLNFIVPDFFKDAEKFEEWIMNIDHENEKELDKLRKVLQFFFLRREKNDVERDLLPKKVINLYSKMTEMQRKWYKGLLERDLTQILGRESRNSLLNILCKLRQCCNHPYLFDGAEPGPPYTTDEHIVQNSGKMIIMDKLLSKLKENGSRVLIFSQMTSMLDIIEDYCNMREYEYRRIDGSTSAQDRVEFIDEFNSEGSDIFIFLLSTRAGGLGINLATADTVILYDIDWNPQVDLQAQDRAHRIGQTKQVTVYRLLIENSIEERIIYQALRKLKLDEVLVRQSSTTKNMTEKDLMCILATGVEELYKENTENDLDISEIIKIGEEKTRKLNTKIDELKINEMEDNKGIYEWEGEDYKLRKKLEDTATYRSSIFKPRVGESIPKFKPQTYPYYHFYPKELFELKKKEEFLHEKNQELSEEEQILKKKYIQEGFSNWNKKEYQRFIRGMEKYGKNDIKKISKYLERDEEDVKKYHKIFWERIEEIPDFHKIKIQIEKGEQKIQKQKELKIILDKIFENNLQIIYAPNTKSKYFSIELDRYILKMYKKNYFNPNCIEIIKNSIINNEKYRFDFFLRSINSNDLIKRMNTLFTNLFRYRDNYL